TPTESINVNTGDERVRGVEGEASYDLLQMWPGAADGEHLTVFANGSYLKAIYTSSLNAAQVGNTPPYAPHYVLKGGVTLSAEPGLKLSLVVDAVGAQYFQASDAGIVTNGVTMPAQIPAYTVV